MDSIEKRRCNWCVDNDIVQKYHDEEWGIPVHDDKKHFEFLLLEVMQCGLNWTMMLKKREIFRMCFDDFDYNKIALYDEAKINKIMNVPGMIKSIRKINAIINNAKLFIKIINEYKSFDSYIWSFSNYKTYVYRSHSCGNIPSKNELSDKVCKDMKKKGFKYLGSITIYSHLQACGIINDHVSECWMYDYIMKNYTMYEVIESDCIKVR
ncbi:DNA-3-methyladenine glycosylase I [Clostridium bornimense]|uniref:DNA-3-methyladenine glycosylase I n=1 Tax=Clostridium bornimense TaxID=1216932 RepID=UPI001C0FC7F4|nr:DNA-3-methyladenine glycosylase I [Clostridium bornimense]MBU5317331.1 DNA-3-methyladenine glycosylase I [Clostridium bornimense]